MGTPIAGFRIHQGTSTSDPVIFDSSVDANVVVSGAPFDVTIDLFDVDYGGETIQSWAVDIQPPAFGAGPVGEAAAAPMEGSTSDPGPGFTVDGTWVPELHFYGDPGWSGTEFTPVLWVQPPEGTISVDDGTPLTDQPVALFLDTYDNHGYVIDAYRVILGNVEGDVHDFAVEPTVGQIDTLVYPTAGIWEIAVYVSTDGFVQSFRFIGVFNISVSEASDPFGTMHVTNASPIVGESIDLTLDTFSDAGMTILSYTIDWGDGTVPTVGGAPSVGVIGSHAYLAEGPFTVTLTVEVESGDVLIDTAELFVAPIPPEVVSPCPSFELCSPWGCVTFDCETPDETPSAGVWSWQEIDGWWNPPAPDRDVIEDQGIPVVAVPTAVRLPPRQIRLKVTAHCGGDDAALADALDAVTGMCDLLRVPGTLTSTETTPKMVDVRLDDRPTFNVRGAALALEVELALIAHDPLRVRVDDLARVL